MAQEAVRKRTTHCTTKYNTEIMVSAKQYAASQNVSILVIEYVCDIEQKGEELLEVAKEIFN